MFIENTIYKYFIYKDWITLKKTGYVGFNIERTEKIIYAYEKRNGIIISRLWKQIKIVSK